ncbi:ataxin-1a [Osmerus mordax]|uniref:ataxin-1a n=1 Tax=Osmerus mordax TaxID=8014 RepID=UPI00350FC571
MKSAQERSNGCLPPKKREILALEQRPLVVAAAATAAPDNQHTENLAWLASVASERCRSTETSSPRFPVSSPSSSSSVAPSLSAVPLTSLPTIYPTTLTQQGGTIQYAQLAPNVQFISSALTGPYAGYISSQILPTNAISNPASGPQRPQLDGYTTLVSQGSKGEQQQFQISLSPDLAVSSTHVSSQYIHLDSTPLTVSAPSGHLQLHPHSGVLPHTLTLGPSQLLVQYADGPPAKKVEGPNKGLVNGDLELGLGKPTAVVKAAGAGHPLNNQQQVHGYEARHILLPADYGQEGSGLQTSLVLVASPQPSTGPELDTGPNKIISSLVHTDKGGICLGRPVSRTSSFSSLSSSDTLKPSTPHTVIQTSHPAEDLPASLYSSGQTPIIGYIASTGHQHAVSYHATLPQHLVIPGGQSLLIPVSSAAGGTRTSDLEVPRSMTATATTPQLTTAMPHAYLATALAKCELLGSDGHQTPPVVQAQVLPIVPVNSTPTVVASSSVPAPAPSPAAPVSIQASSTSPAALPPFFMRGSIIQLADGELKRVEDLRTEDFIQSAEISSELKIDSSTVERIDCSPTPNAVVIQFAVGELKAQVCVEVLVEYPFFVFGQGWSSCCPDRTTQLFELSCAKLCVGDVCVSLTLRSLRNGSLIAGQGSEIKLRSSQGPEPFQGPGQCSDSPVRTSPNHTAHKAANADCLEKDRGPGPSTGTTGSAELRQIEQRRTQSADADKPLGRKRRWSAPERDQTEKAEEEPPMTLPKPSFLPHEVKVSIEGRSTTGS